MSIEDSKEVYHKGLPETDIDATVNSLYGTIINFSPEQKAIIIINLKNRVQNHYEEIIKTRREEENYACIQLEKYKQKFNEPVKSDN